MTLTGGKGKQPFSLLLPSVNQPSNIAAKL